MMCIERFFDSKTITAIELFWIGTKNKSKQIMVFTSGIYESSKNEDSVFRFYSNNEIEVRTKCVLIERNQYYFSKIGVRKILA